MTSDESHVDEMRPSRQDLSTRNRPRASAPASGDPRVDAAMQRAAELAGTSPTEHVEIYEDVHRSLQEVLADASGQPAATELPDPEAGDAVR